ncbi:MAG: arginase family protein, partial [bacterium]
MTVALPLELIGAPFDLAASRRGCRLGPDALRAVDLLGRLRAL